MKTKPALILLVIFAVAFLPVTAQQTGKVTSTGIGYLEYLPDGYHSNSNKYPLVISLHGISEKGTSSTDPERVLRDLPRVANVGLPKYIKNGKKYPFILISPQLKSQYGTWPPSFIMQVLNHVKKNLRVDDRRIYLTGLSLGGYGVWSTAGEYPNVFAAIGPICSGGNAIRKAADIARENMGIWAIHGGSDHVVSYTVTTNMVNAINTAPKKPNPLAKVTIFPNMDHVVWDKAYNETGLLDWMLTFRKGSGGGSQEKANSHPVVSAGQNRTITMPANAVYLEGKATDEDGEVVSYSWTQVSGGSASLDNATTSKLHASGLAEGTYVFRLTVKDNDGAGASDEVSVTVKAMENKPPVAHAGSDRSLTLPDNKLQLQGTATDPDGEIVSYVWKKVSGGSASLSGSNSRTATVSGLQKGVYVFKFIVEDNKGTISTDEILVKVYGEEKSEEPSGGESIAGETPKDEIPGNESIGNAFPTDISPADFNRPVRSHRFKTQAGIIPQKPWVRRD